MEPAQKRQRLEAKGVPLVHGERVPVIIDTDPGVDDAMALLLTLAPKPKDLKGLDELSFARYMDVIGLTIVHGNSSSCETLGRNACHILDLAKRADIPVYLGAEKSILRPQTKGAPHVHGENALGDIEVSEPSTQPVPKEKCNAAQFIVEQCRAHPKKITLVTLGPLTNIAMALQLEPKLAQLVKRVVVMGGAVNVPGNITRMAEANVYNDPEAAHMVFNAGWHVTLAPLNVTHELELTDKELAEWKGLNKITEFIYATSRAYLKFHRDFFDQDWIAVHDSSAVLAVLCPEVFTKSRDMCIDVETSGKYTQGVCVGDLRASREGNEGDDRPKLVTVLLKVDAPRARRIMRERYAAYGELYTD